MGCKLCTNLVATHALDMYSGNRPAGAGGHAAAGRLLRRRHAAAHARHAALPHCLARLPDTVIMALIALMVIEPYGACFRLMSRSWLSHVGECRSV